MNPDAAGLYNDGNKKLKEGNYYSALKTYNEALKIKTDYRIYYQCGVAFKMSGNLDSAKSSFESCLKLKPGFETGLNALGGVYFAMGKYSEALLQTYLFAGFPSALISLNIFSEYFQDEKLKYNTVRKENFKSLGEV